MRERERERKSEEGRERESKEETSPQWSHRGFVGVEYLPPRRSERERGAFASVNFCRALPKKFYAQVF